MKLHRVPAAVSLALVAGLLFACSSGQGENHEAHEHEEHEGHEHHEGHDEHEENEEHAATGAAWDSMGREDRKEFMEHVVMPKMRAAFATWEPEEFAKMKCGACHGAGAKDRSFRMPNPDLPKLPKDAAGFAALEKDEPKAMKFMKEKVVPEMAALLGRKPYDPKTGQGFGCFGCHVAE